MSAENYKLITTIPSGGLDLLTLSPLSVGSLTPLTDGLFSSIPANNGPVVAFDVTAGQTLKLSPRYINEENTALPLLICFGDEGGIYAGSSGTGGGGDASAANQLTQIAAEQAIQLAVESIDLKTPALQGGLVPVGVGNTVDVVFSGVTAINQTDQLAELVDINESTRIGAGWFGKRFKKLLLADMTVSGIDLAAITPAGRKIVNILGSRTSVNGSVIYLEAIENDPGVFLDQNFGANYSVYGVWKTIGPLSSNGCFPLWVVFS